MSDYYWDEKIEYLLRTRRLYHNDDYLEFLLVRVLGITKPVDIIDFGCGAGYLGLTLLPILPKGSRYTGLDRGEELLRSARDLFDRSPYRADFILGDIESMELPEGTYDLAICQALLLHLSDPRATLARMIRSTKPGGKVVCIEPHRNGFLANHILHELDVNKTKNPTILQKLWENDRLRTGRDGNIGIRLPIYMRELGLKDVECRVSDRVTYFHPDLPEDEKEQLYAALQDEAFGKPGEDEHGAIERLVDRGLSPEEAREQLEIEKYLSGEFAAHGRDYNTVAASSMMICYGTKAG